MGETAKLLSERFGKIMQDRETLSINRTDTSVSHSTQLDHAIPASKISSLSAGEFVGMVADDPHQKIKLKMFHAEIQHDVEKLQLDEKLFLPVPQVTDVRIQQVMDNYYQIKLDIQFLIESEVRNLASDFK